MNANAYRHCCHGCPAADRRGFLKSLAAAAVLAPSGLTALAQERPAAKPRVAVFFLSDPQPVENWPWPGWNPEPREKDLGAALTRGCPEVEFEFFSSRNQSLQAGLAGKERFDGALAYLMTLGGSGKSVMPLVEWKKPMILANYVLGGCAPWLTSTTRLLAANRPVVCVSTERDADLVSVAQCFTSAKRMTPEQFAAEGWTAYRKTFGQADAKKATEDPLQVPGVTEIQKQLAAKRLLVVGSGKPGTEAEFLGAKVIYIGFDEFDALCKEVDADAAKEKADKWMQAAEKIVEAQPEAIRASARVGLGVRKLLAKYHSDTVTMNCLGGFAAGKLPAYPCLGFTELLDEGQHGVCEAQVPDAWAMALCRIMTGRAGFVSDPTLDTSTHHIIYAHCMAPTRMLGTDRPASRFRIRTLHNRDPRGACVQSFMPPGYMTTSFRIVGKTLLIHRAKSAGNFDSERGCRSQLVGDVQGDIEKLMRHWHAWHRVTVYGDIRESLTELGKALRLETVEEA
ncbi:MAG: hypothetical protein NTY19_20360 [Planctomycetota bacterium]|nr:hypothetical protein [Planctomycetota bacterium]